MQLCCRKKINTSSDRRCRRPLLSFSSLLPFLQHSPWTPPPHIFTHREHDGRVHFLRVSGHISPSSWNRKSLHISVSFFYQSIKWGPKIDLVWAESPRFVFTVSDLRARWPREADRRTWTRPRWVPSCQATVSQHVGQRAAAAMTVTYSRRVADAGLGTFFHLLLRWRGSIYKLLYRELIIFTVLYYFFSVVYR